MKKYLKYFIFFLIIIFILIFCGYNNTDIIWNYGMAHAIRMGEIPYNDFNIVTTPLYPMLMSIGLFIYDSYIIYIIEQAILVTLFYYMIDKEFNKNALFIMIIIMFPIFYTIFPNYNFLVIFLIVLILLLDIKDKNDYLIGVLLGLLILSKHTVGGAILILSLISTFNWKRIFKRIIPVILIMFIFLGYLLITNSLYSFIDLSILGLFDFGNSNKTILVVYLVIALLIFIHLIVLFKNNYKDKVNYYLLGSFSLIVPICDFFHLNYLIAIYVIIVIYKYRDKLNNILIIPTYILIIFTIIFNIFINFDVYRNMTFVKLRHFDFYLTSKNNYKDIKETYDEYTDGNNNYMFTFTNMFFDIASDHKISYFDIPLTGNFGYDGINKMKKKINKMHGVYFYVSNNSNIQYAKDIYLYIKKSCEYKKTYNGVEIYYKK